MSAGKHPRPRFGTAGLSDSFGAQGFKNIKQMPGYMQSFQLDAFEYQCGRGVRLAEATALVLATDGGAAGIQYSLHAPYYISMSGMDEEKRMGSLRYIKESAAAVRMLGGNRVIFHAGSCAKQSREEALEKARDTLAHARRALDEEGFEDIILCPETMGKINQLGTLEEVLAMCGDDPRHIPCIDFGHLNARTQGGIATKEDFAAILDSIGERLGSERASNFHVHFSKIEYSGGGEVRHLTFKDELYGPDWRFFIELCAERQLGPVVICESDGTQTEDAKQMMDYYNQLIEQ